MNPAKNARILVVDDDPGLRKAIGFDLKRQGYEIREAANGNEALEAVKKESVDLILTDVKMPVCTGVDFLIQLRALHHLSPPVILVSGFSDIDPSIAFHLGADALFPKPFDRKSLMETVQRTLLPREDRWRTFDGSNVTARFARRYTSLENALESREFSLGRGGAFFPMTSDLPRVGEILEFDLQFDADGGFRLHGTGIVRWARLSADDGVSAGVGVEFANLDPHALETVNRWVREHKPREFIPRGPTQDG